MVQDSFSRVSAFLLALALLSSAACSGESSGTGGTSAGGSGGGSTGGTTSGGSGGAGGACIGSGQSCAEGGSCCAGLECCTGMPVPPGQEYCSAGCPKSDRNLKTNFQSVDPNAVLERVATLPVSTWSYKTEDPKVRHIGPMAQDFQATFGVGGSDKTILQVDADGVALASIQALRARVAKLEAKNAELERAQKVLEARVEGLAIRPK
jgi:hypothetical protein